MAMLSEGKKRTKYILQARGKPLYEDKDRFGTKLLQKMGWKEGKGLGAQEEGSKDFIRVRYKNDTGGFGYEERDDHWTQHEEGFNDLLSNLNKSNDSKANDSKEPEEIAGASKLKDKISGISLENQSKKSKARVHYQKFTKGKDISQYSEKDLANIFGMKAKDVAKKNAENELNSITPVSKSEVQMINTGVTVADYFKAKMEKIKRKKPQDQTEVEAEAETETNKDKDLSEPQKKKRKSYSEVLSSENDSKEDEVKNVPEAIVLDENNFPSTFTKKKKRKLQPKELETEETKNEKQVIPLDAESANKNESKKVSSELKPIEIEKEKTQNSADFQLLVSKKQKRKEKKDKSKKLDCKEDNGNNFVKNKKEESIVIEQQSEKLNKKRKNNEEKSNCNLLNTNEAIKSKKPKLSTIEEEIVVDEKVEETILPKEICVENLGEQISKKKRKKLKKLKQEDKDKEVLSGSEKVLTKKANLVEESLRKDTTTFNEEDSALLGNDLKKKKHENAKKGNSDEEESERIEVNENDMDADGVGKKKKKKKRNKKPKVKSTIEEEGVEVEEDKVKQMENVEKSANVVKNSSNVYTAINENGIERRRSSSCSDQNGETEEIPNEDGDVYTISAYTAEKFRNVDLGAFKGCNLGEITGYGLSENLRLEVKHVEGDNERILNLWKPALNKYGPIAELINSKYKDYVKRVTKSRKDNKKAPKLNAKSLHRKKVLTGI